MAYDYIRRAYGKEFKAGQRVQFTETHGEFGTVKRIVGDDQYVRVKFDSGREGRCHPNSLTVIDGKGGDA